MFFDEQIRYRWLAIVRDEFFPPYTCGSVGIRRDELLGFSGPVRRTAERGVDDFLGVGPRILVCDRLNTHVGRFIFDTDRDGNRG